jgi:hypothetical protein
MGVTVCLPLFGDPGRELEAGAVVQGRHLRDLATDLHERLTKAAALVDKLAAGGWAARVALFDFILTHAAVATREDAAVRLRAVGVDPEDLMIVEDVEDEGEDE